MNGPTSDRGSPGDVQARRGGRRRTGAAPADAGRFHRPEAAAREPEDLHRRRQVAQRGARPRAVPRPAGPGQDDAGADRGARDGRGLSRHLGPGDPEGRRPRRPAHQPAAARRAVHRRDPSPQSGDRGDPLSRHGGLPARPDDRRGAGGALGAHRAAALHPGRRHHALGPDDAAAARALRHPAAHGLLRAGRARDDRPSRGARAQDARWPRTAARRSPSARAARRAWPTACCAACATSPPSVAMLWSTPRSPTRR